MAKLIKGANTLPNAAATKVATNITGEKAASITGANSACLNEMKIVNIKERVEWIIFLIITCQCLKVVLVLRPDQRLLQDSGDILQELRPDTVQCSILPGLRGQHSWTPGHHQRPPDLGHWPRPAGPGPGQRVWTSSLLNIY